MSKIKSTKVLIVDDFLSVLDQKKLLQMTIDWESNGLFVDALPYHDSTLDYRKDEHFVNFIIDEQEHLKEASQIIKENLKKIHSQLEEVFQYKFSIDRINEFGVMAANDKTHIPAHVEIDQLNSLGPKLLLSYSFHRLPKKFVGGETFIWDQYIDSRGIINLEEFPNTGMKVERLNNRLLVYEISSFHEFMPLKCDSHNIQDSCFFISTQF